MATFKAVPLDMISAPNYWAPFADGRWTVTDPNATTLWLQLQISDALGSRRYMVATGGTLSVIFQRADSFTTNQGVLSQTSQGISVSGAVNANDRSLFSVALTQQQVQGIVSGTVKFSLTEGSSTTTWVQDYLLSKSLTRPGF